MVRSGEEHIAIGYMQPGYRVAGANAHILCLSGLYHQYKKR
jgi:hypothetical protein